ncbi:ribbon-helix-helix domain-containing protein [Haloarchaeobius sp. DYHT-AS-18]|uniref:ribbon-helix-helix domain-containing protein n=1 Tax=Haloarchaeobius sp. DYHT-AS-18 TaxID=3446117 RepID=UPI003EC02606
MQTMQVTVRLGDVGDELQQHLDNVEEKTGYRPNKSEVVRGALREYFDTTVTDDDQPAGTKEGAA